MPRRRCGDGDLHTATVTSDDGRVTGVEWLIYLPHYLRR